MNSIVTPIKQQLESEGEQSAGFSPDYPYTAVKSGFFCSMYDGNIVVSHLINTRDWQRLTNNYRRCLINKKLQEYSTILEHSGYIVENSGTHILVLI